MRIGRETTAPLSPEFAEAQRLTQELSEHLERAGGLHNVRIQLNHVRSAVRGRAVRSGFLIAIVQARPHEAPRGF